MSYRVSQGESAPASFGRRQPYTIESGKRAFRVRPLTLWASASVIAAMTVWSVGSAAYFTFSDTIVSGMISQQSVMQRSYEDRIAALQAEMDRTTSRHLLDQEKMEQRVETLSRRQTTLETRASALSGLPDTAPARPHGRPLIGGGNTPAPMIEVPTPQPSTPTVLDRQSYLLDSPTPQARGKASTARISHAISRVEESLDRVETDQRSRLLALEDGYGAKALRLRGVLAEIGLDLRKIAPSESVNGLGGPFVPVPEKSDTGAFDRQLERVNLARNHLDRLSKTLHSVPLGRPLAGRLESSSGFGVRMDPFIRAYALHSGLDLRASTGEPVRVTAGGRVTNASWSGGYGRMVEVDHGNGLVTRYGHLSSISVTEDQIVKPGQVVGRVGSTGRSTGPHLHYETRIDGEPVDPVKFLRAGSRLNDKT
ncbi:murein DD-endopeptidase MepM [Variibacter gotjawalensis]|uniref:Murein DD-endopeptidase MepM n=1 Tax=Variibacter gotjawalensis TaxID=1333996 RepID=A0A0S3PY47_9BRAD|nr:M23 family metallopeptidase [Variibacter gotjawalensis]NIK46692.1 murein DD-endopeptidase MepM/ murein hydrolase activator NlpD [Variibacter gotjawalensis]RZS48595.1 peptidase M23-like protein [Variibacter gotjawalensis]BAT60857.1 murein DD-endopeptidase MepM [Variibacter gotjawalensis]